MGPNEMVLFLIVLGFAAGGLGGLLGIGGSILMIPALTILLHTEMHLAQAAAMIVNVFVAVPSTWQHHRARAVNWRAVVRALPFGIAFIVVGVLVGNTFEAANPNWNPRLLERIFGAFLLYVVIRNVHRIYSKMRGRRALPRHAPRTEWWRVGIVGSVVGFAAGILGIGGGVLAVPLFHRLCRMELRAAIAASAAVMCLTAVFGAASKNLSLASHDIKPAIMAIDPSLIALESLLIAGLLAPTAIIGSLVGARLTHALPLRFVRIGFITILTVAGLRMLL